MMAANVKMDDHAIEDDGRRAFMRLSGGAGIAGFGMLAALAGSASAAKPATRQEQAAIRLVSDFLAAWPSRNVDRIASFVTSDIVFKATPNAEEDIGKAAFVAETRRFMELPMVKDLTFADRPSRIHAMGGRIGTAVLALRTDYLKQGDKTIDVPLVGGFWVVESGIRSWYDFPLVNNLGAGEGEHW